MLKYGYARGNIRASKRENLVWTRKNNKYVMLQVTSYGWETLRGVYDGRY